MHKLPGSSQDRPCSVGTSDTRPVLYGWHYASFLEMNHRATILSSLQDEEDSELDFGPCAFSGPPVSGGGLVATDALMPAGYVKAALWRYSSIPAMQRRGHVVYQ
jgi:hypothetical protein